LLVMAGLAVNVFGGWVVQRFSPARRATGASD
jgi:O-acetylserine/cysteine efflux transporter